MTAAGPMTASRLAAMLRRARKPLLVVVSAVLLAGCGSDEEGTIPPGDADNLISLTNAVEEAVAEENCESAEESAAGFVAAVDNLPAEVDDEVKQGLRDAGNQMEELSRDPSQCAPSGASGEDGPEEESSTTSTTVEPETTTETTTTEEETTEEPSTEEEPQEEEEPADNGGPPTNPGNGNGGPSTPPEVEIQPGTDSGGVVPGEGRTP
jgi:hypothetical protein